MKYGMRYCSLPASFEYLSNSSLNGIGADAGLHHFRQRPLADGLRRDLQVAARVVGQFLHVLRRLDREVVAHAGGDQHLLDALQAARAPVQI
jgi:hypothetical protein